MGDKAKSQCPVCGADSVYIHLLETTLRIVHTWIDLTLANAHSSDDLLEIMKTIRDITDTSDAIASPEDGDES